jgi:hypothetical protein
MSTEPPVLFSKQARRDLSSRPSYANNALVASCFNKAQIISADLYPSLITNSGVDQKNNQQIHLQFRLLDQECIRLLQSAFQTSSKGMSDCSNLSQALFQNIDSRLKVVGEQSKNLSPEDLIKFDQERFKELENLLKEHSNKKAVRVSQKKPGL